jgi:nicotinamidase-related amidase
VFQQREQVVIIGIESHVCVLQTVLDCVDAGKEVFVVVDTVSSRTEYDRHYALERMQNVGVTLVTREMVAFEWLKDAQAAEFREVSKGFIK